MSKICNFNLALSNSLFIIIIKNINPKYDIGTKTINDQAQIIKYKT